MANVIQVKGIKAGDLERVADSLSQGRLACLPGDTVYGLAGLPTVSGALDKIYDAKGRGHKKPIALVFESVTQIFDALVSLPERIRKVMLTLLPGPVTAIVPAHEHEKAALGMPGLDGIGVRVIPPPLGKLYRFLPGPLAVTSANLSGQPDPCAVEEIPESILRACDYVIDAGRSPLCVPSTVIDLRPIAAGESARMIREGAVPAAVIERRIEGCGC